MPWKSARCPKRRGSREPGSVIRWFPRELGRQGASLRDMWLRRQSTKYNGVSYPVQRAAQAALSDAGRAACMQAVAYYRANRHLRGGAGRHGSVLLPGATTALTFGCSARRHGLLAVFDYLMETARIVGTPGAGFGPAARGISA